MSCKLHHIIGLKPSPTSRLEESLVQEQWSIFKAIQNGKICKHQQINVQHSNQGNQVSVIPLLPKPQILVLLNIWCKWITLILWASIKNTISIEKKMQLSKAHDNQRVFKSCHRPMKVKINQIV